MFAFILGVLAGAYATMYIIAWGLANSKKTRKKFKRMIKESEEEN